MTMIALAETYLHNRYMPNTVARWGNSLAVRIPKSIAEQAGLGDGSPVDVQVVDGAVVIRPSAPSYTLDELVDQISTKARHGETTTGRARGCETW